MATIPKGLNGLELGVRGMTESDPNDIISSDQLRGIEEVLGPARDGLMPLASEYKSVTHQNLADLYRGRNQTLQTQFLGLMVDSRLKMLSEVAPMVKTDAHRFNWNEWKFEQALARPLPHEGIPYLVETSEREKAAELTRFGISAKFELPAVSTPEGRRRYDMTLRGIAASVAYTQIIDALWFALAPSDVARTEADARGWKDWSYRSYHSLMRRSFAAFNKNPQAFNAILSTVGEDVRNRSEGSPVYFLMPPGTLTRFSEHAKQLGAVEGYTPGEHVLNLMNKPETAVRFGNGIIGLEMPGFHFSKVTGNENDHIIRDMMLRRSRFIHHFTNACSARALDRDFEPSPSAPTPLEQETVYVFNSRTNMCDPVSPLELLAYSRLYKNGSGELVDGLANAIPAGMTPLQAAGYDARGQPIEMRDPTRSGRSAHPLVAFDPLTGNLEPVMTVGEMDESATPAKWCRRNAKAMTAMLRLTENERAALSDGFSLIREIENEKLSRTYWRALLSVNVTVNAGVFQSTEIANLGNNSREVVQVMGYDQSVLCFTPNRHGGLNLPENLADAPKYPAGFGNVPGLRTIADLPENSIWGASLPRRARAFLHVFEKLYAKATDYLENTTTLPFIQTLAMAGAEPLQVFLTEAAGLLRHHVFGLYANVDANISTGMKRKAEHDLTLPSSAVNAIPVLVLDWSRMVGFDATEAETIRQRGTTALITVVRGDNVAVVDLDVSLRSFITPAFSALKQLNDINKTIGKYRAIMNSLARRGAEGSRLSDEFGTLLLEETPAGAQAIVHNFDALLHKDGEPLPGDDQVEASLSELLQLFKGETTGLQAQEKKALGKLRKKPAGLLVIDQPLTNASLPIFAYPIGAGGQDDVKKVLNDLLGATTRGGAQDVGKGTNVKPQVVEIVSDAGDAEDLYAVPDAEQLARGVPYLLPGITLGPVQARALATADPRSLLPILLADKRGPTGRYTAPFAGRPGVGQRLSDYDYMFGDDQPEMKPVGTAMDIGKHTFSPIYDIVNGHMEALHLASQTGAETTRPQRVSQAFSSVGGRVASLMDEAMSTGAGPFAELASSSVPVAHHTVPSRGGGARASREAVVRVARAMSHANVRRKIEKLSSFGLDIVGSIFYRVSLGIRLDNRRHVEAAWRAGLAVPLKFLCFRVPEFFTGSGCFIVGGGECMFTAIGRVDTSLTTSGLDMMMFIVLAYYATTVMRDDSKKSPMPNMFLQGLAAGLNLTLASQMSQLRGQRNRSSASVLPYVISVGDHREQFLGEEGISMSGRNAFEDSIEPHTHFSSASFYAAAERDNWDEVFQSQSPSRFEDFFDQSTLPLLSNVTTFYAYSQATGRFEDKVMATDPIGETGWVAGINNTFDGELPYYFPTKTEVQMLSLQSQLAQ